MTRDAFDFLVFYLSDYDYASHEHGPDTALETLQRCDDAIGALVEAGGGLDGFLERYSVVVMADHGQTRVREATSLAEVYAGVEGVLPLGSNRAAHLYLQPGCRLDPRAVAARLDGVKAAEVSLFREGGEAVARRDGEELVFAPTAGGLFALSGDASILDHPDALPRTWSALANPNAGEILVSAAEGHEFADLGGGTMSEVAPTARSSPATRRCRCCWSTSRARPGASSRSHRSSSLISASTAPRTRWVAPHEPLPSPDVIEPPATTSTQGTAQRVGSALGRRSNWEQLAKFCVVGLSGYVVNLAVYVLLLKVVGLHYLPAAVGSFLVAVANNYTLNRLWTFRGHQGNVAYQGPRFLVVSTLALGANLVVLYTLVEIGSARFPRRRSRSSS